MISKISQVILKIFRHFQTKPVIVEQELLGFKIQTREKLSRVADYDDGWTLALMAHSKNIFDVGCNIGFFTLLARLTEPSREIVMVDANLQALRMAAENLFLNGLSEKVHFVLGFASEKEDEEKDFFVVGTGAASSMFSTHAKTAAKQNSKIKIRTTTIDKIMEDTKVVPELVKMDIEGAEKFALQGAKKLAALNKTRFIVEMHSNKQLSMEDNGESILSWCREVGYQAFYLSQHISVDTAAIFSGRGRCHLLLQPKGWEYPEYLKGINQFDSLEKVAALMTKEEKVLNSRPKC